MSELEAGAFGGDDHGEMLAGGDGRHGERVVVVILEGGSWNLWLKQELGGENVLKALRETGGS